MESKTSVKDWGGNDDDLMICLSCGRESRVTNVCRTCKKFMVKKGK